MTSVPFDLNLAAFDLAAFDEALKLIAAFLFALPIAWEREQSTRIMGLRTFPLVSLGSCAYIIIGLSWVDPGSEISIRLVQGLMAGIGFIGGGAILKGDGRVHGTATAASVWVTGAVGAGIGFGRYDVALTVVVLNFIILRLLTLFKVEPDEDEVA